MNWYWQIVISLRLCLVFIQILINDTVTRLSIINRWQVFTRFVNTNRDWTIIVEWKRYSDCFSHLRERVAKLTSSDVSILTCENWYWDWEMTSNDWISRHVTLFTLNILQNNLGLKNDFEGTGISTLAISRSQGSTVHVYAILKLIWLLIVHCSCKTFLLYVSAAKSIWSRKTWPWS